MPRNTTDDLQGGVTLDRRVRPLRLGFLVDPRSSNTVLEAMSICTVLWGGRYNPMIPVYKTIPRGWPEFAPKGSTSTSVARGYISVFDPDFVVETYPGAGGRLGFPSKRVIPASAVLDPARDEPVEFGVDVTRLYDALYRREYRFVQRGGPATPVTLPEAMDPEARPLMGGLYGTFPSDSRIGHFRSRYTQLLAATAESLSVATILNPVLRRFASPLTIGARDLQLSSFGWSFPLLLFVIDHRRTIDVIDFWNLRALGWRVLPIPIDSASQWLPKIRDALPQYFDAAARIPRVALIRSQSVDTSLCAPLAQQVGAVYQAWYPRMWDEWGRGVDHVNLPSLAAERTGDDTALSSRSASLRDIGPRFLEEALPKRSYTGTPSWATVLNIHKVQPTDVASALPNRLERPGRLFEVYGTNEMWLCREGAVVGTKNVGWPRRIKIPTGDEVFKVWAKEGGFEIRLSAAGRLCMQVVRSLRGLDNAYWISHAPTMTLLNQLAHWSFEDDGEDALRPGKGKVRAGTVDLDRLRAVLSQIHLQEAERDGVPTDRRKAFAAERAETHIHRLVEHHVLQIGLRLQCPECTQFNWYPLDKLADELTCERCLAQFPFPYRDPDAAARWHYRPIGPFATGDYAGGAMTVTLALRFLAGSSNAETTWLPAFEFVESGKSVGEVDFAMFWRRSFSYHGDSQLIFGECKSGLARFSPKDYRLARRLLRQFPGSAFVFCTPRQALHKSEREEIGRIARRGRGSGTSDEPPSPVVVLTGHELLGSTHEPPICWNDVATYTDALDKEFGRASSEIFGLARVTQQLHLGLESYDDLRKRAIDAFLTRHRIETPGPATPVASGALSAG